MSSVSQKTKKLDHCQKKNRQATLDKIIEAAQLEFVINGFKGTTIQSIADRAELPKPNILYYYKSKKILLQSVIAHNLSIWNDFIGEFDTNDEPVEAIKSLIVANIKLSFTHPIAVKLYAMEMVQGGHHLDEFMRTCLREWVRDKVNVFQSWIEAGKMKPIDAENLIFLIWSTTQNYIQFESTILNIKNQREYEDKDIKHITDFLVSFILRGCQLSD